MTKRPLPSDGFERRMSERAADAPIRHGRVADSAVTVGVLAVSLGIFGCGGKSGSHEAEAPGGDSQGATTGAQSAPADANATTDEPAPSAEQFAAAVVAPPDRLDRADTSGGAWRTIEVPGASNLPSVIRTPSGWLALSSRFRGPDPKVPTGGESALYRSGDGVHWQLSPLGPGSDNVQLQSLAYGAGRYVMVGARFGSESVVWTSADAEHWTKSSQALSMPFAWSSVTFVKDRFFAFGFSHVASSSTGESWTDLPTHLVQYGAGAYGNGRYLLLGNGPMQTSENGEQWQEHTLDCDLPGACITDPSGGVHPSYHIVALFAEGRFFTEQLSSLDGAHWDAQPGLSPAAYIGGHFVGGTSLTEGLAAWKLGEPAQTLRVIRPYRAAETLAGRDWVGVLDHEAPLPETVDASFEDGLNCETGDCVLVGGSLLLVPPAGTPPLVDHVPRSADGSPLLTRECPVSSMVFCDDYAARTGCTCNTEAPREPEGCDDVSQYRCAGQFVARPNEWQLDELAQAGCTCDAVDPNEPPGVGRTCSAENDTCQASLECLGIDPPPSIGPPSLQPFVCTSRCAVDADCPSWEATGFCSGPVHLRCSNGSCQPRACD